MILVAYLGSAVRANAFGSHRISLRPTEDVKKPQPSSPEELALEAIAKLRTGRLLYEVAHQMELVYRLAVFDTFLNNLTSYALASLPTKAIGSSQIPVGVLLAKTRGTVINDCIAGRAKSLA